MEIGIGGGGQLDLGTLLKYAHFIYGLPNGHFFRDHIDNTGLVQDTGSSDFLPDPTYVAKAVGEFQNPQVDAPHEAAVAAHIAKARKKPWSPAPAKTTVIVLNGNGVSARPGPPRASSGSAGTGGSCRRTGRRRTRRTSDFSTEVYYDPAWGPGKLAATGLAALFHGAQVGPMPADIVPLAHGAHMVAIVGQDFRGTLAAAPTPTIKHAPPKVRPALAETKPLVVAARKQLHFKLAAPSLLDVNSRPDTYVASRVYPLNKDHKALRLVFKSSLDVGGYWGIEESDWPDAPALANPSYTRRIAGRTYDFYLTGSHIHMVVAHGPGNARYWVVNTLLDLISNETMVSVAKGLRVLPR